MIVNAGSLRIRHNDRTVKWYKQGETIDLENIPEATKNKVLITNQVVDDADAGKMIKHVSDKKMPKATNKTVAKKVVKKAIKKG
jgi:hypothetical protein